MAWWPLRKSSIESLSVSMAGVKLGDRLLMVGCTDPILLAQLAAKTGLTGRAFAVDEREGIAAAAENIATREGALVETSSAQWTSLPVESGSFDVAVIRDVLSHLPMHPRAACISQVGAACISEVARALRPGGRCLVIDGTVRKRIGAIVRGGSAAGGYGEQRGPV